MQSGKQYDDLVTRKILTENTLQNPRILYALDEKRVVIQDEAYTSETCSSCGNKYFIVKKSMVDAALRWTEISMMLAVSSCGLCLIQAWLFYEELAVDMIRLNSFYTLTIFDYLSIDPLTRRFKHLK